MFKENRFIFEHAEFSPSGQEGRRLSFGKRKRYNGGEVPREVREKEQKEKEDSVRVAEKLLNNLEIFAVECPRCGLKNVAETSEAVNKAKHVRTLYCLDCKYKWEVPYAG
jgi:DNA-directed RNA polymerase subunit M/transcription elongation factor TFIIS